MEKMTSEKQINNFLRMFRNNLHSGYQCIEQVTDRLEMRPDESDSLITPGKPIDVVTEYHCSHWLSLKREDCFRFSMVEEDPYGDHMNVFFSPFIFRNAERNQQASRYLSALYVDIDHCAPEDALKRLKQLPQELHSPSAIVSSGNGVHIYWVLGYKPKVSAYLKLWQRTMRELAKRLDGDTRVIDHARLMRLPGTWNQKQGITKPCVLLELNETQTIELIDCAKCLGTYATSVTTKQERKNTRKKPSTSSRKTKRTYNYYLQQEVLSLLKRRAFHGDDIGYRNSLLRCLRQLGVSDRTLDYVNESLFSDPLSQREVDAIKKYTWLPPKRSTIIATFNLTLTEEKESRYLVNEELYSVRKEMGQLYERTLPSLTRRLLRILGQKYAKKKQSLKATASDLQISTKTASKYRKSRSKEQDYFAIHRTLLEAGETLDSIQQSLVTVDQLGWSAEDEQKFQLLQESSRKLRKLSTESRLFQKKQLSVREYHALLVLVHSLQKLARSFKTNQSNLGEKEDGKS